MILEIVILEILKYVDIIPHDVLHQYFGVFYSNHTFYTILPF